MTRTFISAFPVRAFAATRVEASPTPTGQGTIRTYGQAVLDLASLRLEQVEGQWFPAAGVPRLLGKDADAKAYACRAG